MSGFWRGRRIFITGHTGFKGSWLALWLHALGAEVQGFALAPDTLPAMFNALGLADNVRSMIGDVRDLSLLRESLVAFEPDTVIHMAAQPLVRRSYSHPVDTYAVNVMGTVNLLEAARTCSTVGAIVVVTTDKCYENREWAWGYREAEPMGGFDPYSSSKGCAELVTAAYRRSFYAEPDTAKVASARAGNVIGGGDWATDRLIPDILRAFEQEQAVTVRNPRSIRPWQHVLEPLSGYLMLAQALHERGQEVAEGWNFGPRDEDARPVEWIVRRMAALWGGRAGWARDGSVAPHEARYLKLDISKAGSDLGWHPRWHLDEALTQIVAWHRTWLDRGDIRAETLRQIRLYEASASA